MKSILLIEDEKSVASFIKKGLIEEGYDVQVAYEGEAGLEFLLKNQVELIILDIILPDIDGLEVCKRIKSEENIETPVLILTALGKTDNVVKGLDAGADDYLVKPFKFKELMARIRALLRRRNYSGELNKVLKVANLELDLVSKIVSRGGKEINLTATEYRLLEYLIKNKEKVLSRVDLLENVWDVNFDIGTNVVDVYVNYLRNKIDKGYEPKLIKTVVGRGYILKEEKLN